MQPLMSVMARAETRARLRTSLLPLLRLLASRLFQELDLPRFPPAPHKAPARDVPDAVVRSALTLARKQEQVSEKGPRGQRRTVFVQAGRLLQFGRTPLLGTRHSLALQWLSYCTGAGSPVAAAWPIALFLQGPKLLILCLHSRASLLKNLGLFAWLYDDAIGRII